MFIEIKLTLEDLINEIQWFKKAENDEKFKQDSIEYIADNFTDIIESEEDSLRMLINESDDSLKMASTVHYNDGNMIIVNDDGEELGELWYNTDISI